VRAHGPVRHNQELEKMLQQAGEEEMERDYDQSWVGPGWKEVPSFEELDDLSDYEEEEEVSEISLLSISATRSS